MFSRQLKIQTEQRKEASLFLGDVTRKVESWVGSSVISGLHIFSQRDSLIPAIFKQAFLMLLYYLYQCLLYSWEIILFVFSGYCTRLKMRNTSIKFVRVQYVIFFCDKENEKDSCSYILITFIGYTHCLRPRISLAWCKTAKEWD